MQRRTRMCSFLALLTITTATQVPLEADDGPAREQVTPFAECLELSLASAVNSNGPRHDVEITAPALGTEAIDLLFLEFYSPATGTFDLASGHNTNYSTCQQCVLAFVDEGAGPLFFQQGGTLEVNGGQPMNSILDAELFDVTLVEVTIDFESFVSTPVPGGDCLHITSASLVTSSKIFADGFEPADSP